MVHGEPSREARNQAGPSTRREARRPASASASAGHADEESLGAEAALLTKAHRALLRRPRRTLELAAEHAARFPAGLMADEREVIAIEALVRQGRREEADARGRAFLEARPASPYAGRVTRLLGLPAAGSEETDSNLAEARAPRSAGGAAQ